MAVTQKQIAERLNVSRALVARALNGADEVSQVMRERVQAVAAEMGYNASSNHMARSLIARRYGQRIKSGIIAVATSSEDVTSPRDIPFFSPILQGLETEAAEQGIDLCLCLIRNGETPRLLQDKGVDGIVALTTLYRDMAAMLTQGIPVVTIQACTESAHSVSGDDRQGGYLATRHLLELGHRHIAFLGVDLPDNGERIVSLRKQGYLDALTEFGIMPRDAWIDCSLPLPNTSRRGICTDCGRCAACQGWQTLKSKSAGTSTARPPFTAVVCHNDPVAMGLVRQAEQDGISVPRDLSVTGFDVSRDYNFHPEITSIGFPYNELGRDALKLLQELADSSNTPDPATFRHRVLPATLEIRASTAPPSHR